MTAIGTVTRLATMDRQELRFRLACEARNVVGRLRFKVSPPRLDRTALGRVLDPAAGPLVAAAIEAARRGDALAAHRALALHFQTRVSRWPLQASARATLAGAIRRDFRDAAREAGLRADRILDGRHDLLGFRNIALGNPPDWHADAVHRRRAPLMHWSRVPFLDPALGDHKIIWETNRHQVLAGAGDGALVDRGSPLSGHSGRPPRRLDPGESATGGRELGEHARARVPLAFVDVGGRVLLSRRGSRSDAVAGRSAVVDGSPAHPHPREPVDLFQPQHACLRRRTRALRGLDRVPRIAAERGPRRTRARDPAP